MKPQKYTKQLESLFISNGVKLIFDKYGFETKYYAGYMYQCLPAEMVSKIFLPNNIDFLIDLFDVAYVNEKFFKQIFSYACRYSSINVIQYLSTIMEPRKYVCSDKYIILITERDDDNVEIMDAIISKIGRIHYNPYAFRAIINNNNLICQYLTDKILGLRDNVTFFVTQSFLQNYFNVIDYLLSNRKISNDIIINAIQIFAESGINDINVPHYLQTKMDDGLLILAPEELKLINSLIERADINYKLQ
jgi:hypothetical protein